MPKLQQEAKTCLGTLVNFVWPKMMPAELLPKSSKKLQCKSYLVSAEVLSWPVVFCNLMSDESEMHFLMFGLLFLILYMYVFYFWSLL